MRNKSWMWGLFQALGLMAYIFLVASFMQNAEHWFGSMDNFLGPLLFLSLFSFSALACGLITFFYPLRLVLVNKKPKKAIETVLFTALFLFVFLVGMLVAMI